MRILLCVKRDLAGAVVLNQMIEQLSGHQLKVFLSDKTRPAENNVYELKELMMLERSLPDLVFPMLDRLNLRGRYRTFAGLARDTGVAFDIVTNLTSPAVIADVRQFAPDLIISIRFSLIFKQPILGIPRYGVLNIHPGALPEYGGLFAPMRSILHGESEIKVTCHFADEGIDTGPIVGIGALPFDPARSLEWYVMNLYPIGFRFALEAIAQCEQGLPIPATPQDPARRGYFSMPHADEFERLAALKVKLYDPMEYVECLSGFMPEGYGEQDEILTRLLQTITARTE